MSQQYQELPLTTVDTPIASRWPAPRSLERKTGPGSLKEGVDLA